MGLTLSFIGAAMSVPRALGPGIDEKIDENARGIELMAPSLSSTQQQQFAVFYREQSVGKLITDLIVENKAVIETNFLCISGLQVGLIPNLKTASLSSKRVANVYPQNP